MRIEQQIRDEWSYFESDFDRAVTEMADSLVPVYDGEVIREWSGLSSDDSDRWQEFGVPDGFTIVSLMRIDLFINYEMLIRQIATQISKEMEAN